MKPKVERFEKMGTLRLKDELKRLMKEKKSAGIDARLDAITTLLLRISS